MADYRIPYNSKYCKEIDCEFRSGSKCTKSECIAKGGNKWAVYWTDFGYLPDGGD